MVDPEETDADPRLDALLRSSGQVWPKSDADLDAWLAGQELSDQDEGWLRDVIRRRISEAATPADASGQAIGTPVSELPAGAAAAKAAPEPAPASARPLSYDDLALLNEQLLELVRAGVSLPGGLAAYAADLREGRLEQVMGGLRRDLEAGHSLSEAMRQQGAALPPLYRSLVAAGEAGGDLTTCLALLQEQAEVDADLDRRVKESLTYPASTFGLALACVLVIVAWIAPQFREIFDNMGVTLPLITQAFLTTSGWINAHPFLSAIGASGLVYGAYRAFPHVAPNIVRALAGHGPGRHLGELSRALAGFLSRGVPLPAALEALREADLELPTGTLERVQERLRSGETLADALRPEAAFPPTYVWLVGAAEARGDLPAALTSLARRHERAYKGRLRYAEAVVAPMAMCIIGLVVGISVLAIFLPIFELQRALQT